MSDITDLALSFLERNKNNLEILSFAAETHIRNLLRELDTPQNIVRSIERPLDIVSTFKRRYTDV